MMRDDDDDDDDMMIWWYDDMMIWTKFEEKNEKVGLYVLAHDEH